MQNQNGGKGQKTKEGAMGRKSLLRWVAGVAVSVMSGFTFVSQASALSFDEFERLPEYQKMNFVSTALHHYYFRFSDNPMLASKANCMTDLDGDSVRDGDRELFDFVMRDLEGDGAASSQYSSVEQGIRAVIDRACGDR